MSANLDRALRVLDAVEGGLCWRCDTHDATSAVGLCDHCLAVLRDPDHLHPPTIFERLRTADGPALPTITIVTPEDVLQCLHDVFEQLWAALRPVFDAVLAAISEALAAVETGPIPAPKRPARQPPPPTPDLRRTQAPPRVLPVRPWHGRR